MSSDAQLQQVMVEWETRAHRARAAWKAIEANYRDVYDRAQAGHVSREDFEAVRADYTDRRAQFDLFKKRYQEFYEAHPQLVSHVQGLRASIVADLTGEGAQSTLSPQDLPEYVEPQDDPRNGSSPMPEVLPPGSAAREYETEDPAMPARGSSGSITTHGPGGMLVSDGPSWIMSILTTIVAGLISVVLMILPLILVGLALAVTLLIAALTLPGPVALLVLMIGSLAMSLMLAPVTALFIKLLLPPFTKKQWLISYGRAFGVCVVGSLAMSPLNTIFYGNNVMTFVAFILAFPLYGLLVRGSAVRTAGDTPAVPLRRYLAAAAAIMVVGIALLFVFNPLDRLMKENGVSSKSGGASEINNSSSSNSGPGFQVDTEQIAASTGTSYASFSLVGKGDKIADEMINQVKDLAFVSNGIFDREQTSGAGEVKSEMIVGVFSQEKDAKKSYEKVAKLFGEEDARGDSRFDEQIYSVAAGDCPVELLRIGSTLIYVSSHPDEGDCDQDGEAMQKAVHQALQDQIDAAE